MAEKIEPTLEAEHKTPVVETGAPVETPPVETPPVEGETTKVEATPEVPPAPKPEQPKVEVPKEDWRDKRIAKLSAQVKELREKGGAPAAKTQQEELDQLVQTRAQELAAQQEFNRNAEAAAEAGRAQFGKAEFDAATQRLVALVDQTDQKEVVGYYSFIAAALETGEAHKVIFELAKDPGEADRVMKLPPARMGVALAKLAAKVPEEVSRAPKPILPLGGGGKGASRSEITPGDKERADALTTAEWMARREADVKKQREARPY